MKRRWPLLAVFAVLFGGVAFHVVSKSPPAPRAALRPTASDPAPGDEAAGFVV